MDIVTTLKDSLINKYTVGGALLIVGVSTLITPPMSDLLNRVWASPMGMDITLLRFGGLLTTALGVAVLFNQDPLGFKAEV